MMHSQAVLVIAGLSSMMMALASGKDAVEAIIAGPLIEGEAVYSDPVRAGETVVVPWRISKKTDCPGENGRVWNGAAGFHLSEVKQFTGLPVGDGEYLVQTKIPDLAPAGDLTLTISGAYQCAGEHPVSFDLGPVVFRVK